MELSAQVDQIVRAVQALGPASQRQLIAIAGPPAAGKTTLARAVQDALVSAGRPCGLVQMDGFHLSNDVLSERSLLQRKGAPETFDLEGFARLLRQLLTDPEVAVPGFDRHTDSVIPEASRVVADQRHVVVEGNYLLLRDLGWDTLADLWSFAVFVAPPIKELRARLVQRWIDHGLPAAAAEDRAQNNDLRNAQLILDHSNLDRVGLRLT